MFRSVPGPSAGIQFGPFHSISAPCDEAIMGNVEVSPVATTTGEVGQGQLPIAKKHVYVIHDNNDVDEILIARCFWVAFGPPVANTSDPSGVRCDDLPVASFPGSKTGANFPSLAIDKAGNLYAIWQQAPPDGDTSLYFSYSTNEGTTWSAPVQIPTPGLLNNVFTWAAAGDDGRVGFAWYGSPSPEGSAPECPEGPDAVKGPWGVYYTMTANGHGPGPVVFEPPVLASQHPIHASTMFTLIGGQCGNRDLGDFLYMQVGAQGEAHIAYASTLTRSDSKGMYVRQNGGPGLYANQTVAGDPILLNSATDPSGDGKYELGGIDDPNKTNLDVVASSFTKPPNADCHPVGACYRITMTLNNLSLAPQPVSETNLVWLTQWFLPSDPACSGTSVSCARGGKNFFVYGESTGGQALRCWVGEGRSQRLGGGLTNTYPGATEITAAGACAATTGPNGKITIDVPIADVSLDAGVNPLGATRYSVTASTMTLPQPANQPPVVSGFGGSPPDVADVVRAYNAVDTPTAAALRSLTAVAAPRSVTIRWRTGTEVSVAGFHVYREVAGKRVRLSRRLIPASGGAAGRTYAFRERRPDRGARYWVQALGVDGARHWLGSTTVGRA
ncbi:MAG: hypothetical protein ABR521_14070 [Gaiellaceae bacterium]